MDHLLAIDVFNDCTVTRGVRHRKMQSRQTTFTRHLRSDYGEGLGFKHRDRFGNTAEIIQNVLRPGRDA